jgi:hypothetical protein
MQIHTFIVITNLLEPFPSKEFSDLKLLPSSMEFIIVYIICMP